MDSRALWAGELAELGDFYRALCYAQLHWDCPQMQSLHVCGLREGVFAIWRLLQ